MPYTPRPPHWQQSDHQASISALSTIQSVLSPDVGNHSNIKHPLSITGPPQPPLAPKIDLKLDAPENPNGGVEIAVAHEAIDAFVPLVALLVDLPSIAIRPGPTPGDEDGSFDTALGAMCAQLLRPESHADADRLAGFELGHKVPAAPRIVHEAAAVVAVHAETRAVPAGQPPHRVRLPGVSDRDARVGVGDVQNADLKVYRLGSACQQRVVLGGEV